MGPWTIVPPESREPKCARSSVAHSPMAIRINSMKYTVHRPMSERFWEKVDKKGEDDCWLWTASHDHLGYGRFYVNDLKRKTGAHRVAYELVIGPIPPRLVIDHLCKNPPCVNPKHLEPVPQYENICRGSSHSHPHKSAPRPKSIQPLIPTSPRVGPSLLAMGWDEYHRLQQRIAENNNA